MANVEIAHPQCYLELSRHVLPKQITNHHISTSDLKATGCSACACVSVRVCVLASPCPVSLISLLRGKHYIGSCCLLNTLGLSNLCCSETSHSISSVDRCHCSLSPLGAHSFSPAFLRLFACVRPLQNHQVSHLLNNQDLLHLLQRSREGLIINIQTPVSCLRTHFWCTENSQHVYMRSDNNLHKSYTSLEQLEATFTGELSVMIATKGIHFNYSPQWEVNH